MHIDNLNREKANLKLVREADRMKEIEDSRDREARNTFVNDTPYAN